MKRLAAELSTLIVFALIIIFAGLYINGLSHNTLKDAALQKDLASMPNADAVRIALNDSGVQAYLANHTYESVGYDDFIYRIENNSNVSFANDMGFIDSPDVYDRVVILVTGNRSYMDTIQLLVTVDMTKKEVSIMQPVHMIAWVPEIHAIIPPGACWYHPMWQMGLDYIQVKPENSSAYVAIFSDDEFKRFRNGVSYNASVYDGGKFLWINTTNPFEGNTSDGKISPIYPGLGQNVTVQYYLVVKNTDKNRDITVDAGA
jgi:hypothetical protein